MNRLRQLWKLSWGERLSLGAVSILLLATRFGLRWISIASLHQRLLQASRFVPVTILSPARILWAAETAGRHLGCTCLSQSLVTQALLQRTGQSSYVVVGMTSTGSVDAHAWVESEGRVLLGGNCERFEPLFHLGDKRA